MTSNKKNKSDNSKNPKKFNLEPVGDRIIIRPLSGLESSSKTASGIIIPDTVSKEKPEQGIVVAVGNGRLEKGERIPLTVKVGDRIIFSRYGYDEVKYEDEEYYVIREENILAIIK